MNRVITLYFHCNHTLSLAAKFILCHFLHQVIVIAK
jgi:hypothetical protein